MALTSSITGVAFTALALGFFLCRAVDGVFFDVDLNTVIPTDTVIVCVAVASVAILASAWRHPFTAAASMAVACALLRGYADQTIGMPELPPHSTCLVTGANSGIGFAVSRALAQAGHTVVMGCRSQAKCDVAADQVRASTGQNMGERSDGGGGRVIALGGLDLASLSAVHRFVPTLRDALDAADVVGPITVLVNNAGLVPIGRALTKEGLEMGLGVMVSERRHSRCCSVAPQRCTG